MRLATRIAAVLLAALPVAAQSAPPAQRIVVLKIDGLPPRLLETPERFPWMRRIFSQNGTTLKNFYVRGLSLSAPSWSLLDTGRPLEIHGNVEYDRYTLRPYDYLNFVPFYFSASTGGRVDMRGVELLDELQVPLLLDRFPVQQRHQSVQLLQRGVNWATLKSALKRFVSKAPREFLDEWIIGLSMSDSVVQQNEHELIEALKNPEIRYLDYFGGEYDHVAHLTNDPVSQVHQVEELDAFIGRVWTAIQSSPYRDSTVLVVVSDHGMNTSGEMFSQGYNLVDWFGSTAGGAHHVLTNRHPMSEFKMRGLDPFVSAVVTPSRSATYLKDQGEAYPTAMLDLDGNERASIGLRNNTLNVLHLLLKEITRKGLAPKVRVAAIDGLMEVLNQVRPVWSADLDNLDRELADLETVITDLEAKVAAQPKKWTEEQLGQQLHRDANRQARQLALFREDRAQYGDYARVIRRLLALTPADFDPGRFKPGDLIPIRSLGPLNTAWDLQHYVTALGPKGLVTAADGTLDWEGSFARVNYFQKLHELRVKNNVQAGVGPRPVDFIAATTPDGIWLYQDEEHQALIQSNGNQLRYLPIAHLTGDPDGSVRYEERRLAAGFPLAYAEDPDVTASDEWLTEWHTQQEWFEAVHRARYSNGIVGLFEQLQETTNPDPLSQRKRHLRRTDLLVLAADHWNFNVRGFNPGGNHGSFLRTSTHSVLMFTGGPVPRGLAVEAPYDSLSFVPTVLQLMGMPEPDLPGPVIEELFPK